MAEILPYLTFNGNCKEAMTFYQQCLGGKLTLQTLGKSPKAKMLPKAMKHYVVHAKLVNKNIVLQATDLIDDQTLQKGNNISLILECKNNAEMMRYFTRLSKDGEKSLEPQLTNNGNLLASIRDKFGMQWLLNLQSISN